MKDLEWAKKRLKDMFEEVGYVDAYGRGYRNGLRESVGVLNQIEQPETLSKCG